MNVTRILRRAAVLGVTGTVFGVGMLVAAPPAHAMSQSECDHYFGRFLYWEDRAFRESNATRRRAYIAAAYAARDVWIMHDCV
jgi:hypothetical protein